MIMIPELSPEQWAMVAFVGGAVATEIMHRCPKGYRWLKAVSGWLHKKLDVLNAKVAVLDEIPDELKAATAAFADAVATFDAAIEDENITYDETVLIKKKAWIAYKAAKAAHEALI